MGKFSKKLSAMLALSLVVTGTGVVMPMNSLQASAATSTLPIVENLDRGITAVNTGSGMLVSWRYLANDSDSTVFKLYRNNSLVYTSNQSDATCYLDSSGTYTDTYRVDTINSNVVTSSDTCEYSSNSNYFDLSLDVPTTSTSGVTYSPNDCTVGDVDGDGEYELFVKWDPSNSKDNSQKGTTDKVYIDCYKLNGTKLWRIDLGCNIRAGAHYTQMLVADYDSDGEAELICKTADGTIDGTGTVIGDDSKDYRNSNGYILTGPEYLTLFEGATGKALDTIDYNPGRGTVSSWGDSYGNRVDRFLGAVAYLDGEHPSAITVRGYYTRMTACAYDVVDNKLVEKWFFDTNDSANSTAYGDGNHNCMPADVDGDGKQELVLGDTCIDDDGSLLWCLNKGHGDALHVGDLDPENDGLEVWTCHENSPYGVTLIDADTGKSLFHVDGSSDTGRCCADNVWSGNDGAEYWAVNDVYDSDGNVVASRSGTAVNFLTYWDGDLEREILDDINISKVKSSGSGMSTLFTATGCSSNNSTKATPNLSADLFGDWREEVILRTEDNSTLRIFCTTYDTDYRITTLMQDPQYRNQVAGENIAYNQPPHASFYLGSDQDLPDRPNVTVLGASETTTDTTLTAATLTNGAVYMIQNVNSGLYMEVEGGTTAAGTNVQQWGASGSAAYNSWRVLSAGDGYYYLYSQIGDKVTYLLDLSYGSTADGTNIQIYTDTKCDAQLFKFVKNDDGSYYIVTKSSGDKSCLMVANNSTSSGANVIQSALVNSDAQKWNLTQVTPAGDTVDTQYTYMLKNVNSGLYLDVTDGVAADGTNVQQWAASSSSYGAYNTWKFVSAGNGYYYIYSMLGDGATYLLDVTDGKAANGSNIEILQANNTSSQLFKFVLNPDGTYNIVTKASKDLGALDVASASTSNGGNVIQYSSKNSANQQWVLEKVATVSVSTTTSSTSTSSTSTNSTSTANTTTSSGKTYVSLTQSGNTIDVSDYADKNIVALTFELSSVSTGSGSAQLKTASGGWLGSADFSYSDTDKVTVDLSSYSNIGTIDLYMWWNSQGASISNIQIVIEE